MNHRRAIAIATAAAAAATAAAMVSNAYRFRIDRLDHRVAALREPLRVAFLADLHYGPFIRAGSVAKWVDAALAQEPDLVVIGGDLVDAVGDHHVGPLLRELSRLRAPLGVFATWGNHDHGRFEDVAPFGDALEAHGVEVLWNRGVLVRDDLYLAGIDDYGRGSPDLEAALRDRPPGKPCLLIAHNPESLTQVPLGVDLTLAGHTHGGQVLLPVVGPLVKASDYTQRFLRGWSRQPALGYISRGLGVSILPFRLNCPAELTVMDLLPAPVNRGTAPR